MMGLVPFYEHDESRGLSLCCVKTQAGDSFCGPGRGHQTCRCLDLGLPASRAAGETCLWFPVMAAPIDQDNKCSRNPRAPRSHCGQSSPRAPTRAFTSECWALPPAWSFWTQICLLRQVLSASV